MLVYMCWGQEGFESCCLPLFLCVVRLTFYFFANAVTFYSIPCLCFCTGSIAASKLWTMHVNVYFTLAKVHRKTYFVHKSQF